MWSDTSGVDSPSGYNFPNSSGFTYQAEAVHRCLAAGLLECPQYTKDESLCVTTILDGIQAALEAQPPPIAAPTPVFDGQLPSMPSAAMTQLCVCNMLTQPCSIGCRCCFLLVKRKIICQDRLGTNTD